MWRPQLVSSYQCFSRYTVLIVWYSAKLSLPARQAIEKDFPGDGGGGVCVLVSRGGGEKRDKKTGKLHPLEYSILTVKHETLTWIMDILWKRGTSYVGSQYRYGPVGRGIQPQSIPSPHAHLHIDNHNCIIVKVRFHTFDTIITDGPTNGSTDGQASKE